MSRPQAVALIVASVVVLAAALILLSRLGSGDGAAVGVESPSPTPASQEETAAYQLFFPGPGGLLHVEERQLPRLQDRKSQAGVLVESLLAGPESGSLQSPFPTGTVVRAIDEGPDGALFVSLGAAESGIEEKSFAMGSRAELLMVYSLVDSLAYNVEGVESVAILWNGAQLPTLAGHVDTSRPLRPSRDWVAR